MNPTEPDSICSQCGYSLEAIKSARCPECGWPIDRSRYVAPPHRLVHRLTAPLILSGVVAAPCLFVVVGFRTYSGAPSTAFQILFPYCWLALRLLPTDAAIPGWAAGMFQGPLYGFVLGLNLPSQAFPRVWSALALVHVIAAIAALCV